MDWNRGEHARKFLRSEARYLHAGTERSGPIAFWLELEPQSRVVRTFPRDGVGPRWLHEPEWQVPRHLSLLRNTDPMVFGERFLYSNCRQMRNRKLRELAPGSLILFGSKVRSEFVLDTAFVVGSSELYGRHSANSISVEPFVRAVVFDPLARERGLREDQSPEDLFRLYRSRTYDERPGGPYSFVPCRPDGPNAAFARPAIRLDTRWIEPNLAMGAKATEASAAEIVELWDQVVQQVRAQGLARAVHLDAPHQIVDAVAPAETT